MDHLKTDELSIINQYLDQQGLTFTPLREEMLDHILGDVNLKISQGATFNEAWNSIISEIPENHFRSIQSEIMQTIHKKFNISKGLSYVSLLLILVMVVFKLLHLSLSGILLLIAFGTMGAGLFFASLFGLYPFSNKLESFLALGAIIGIELFLLSFGFQVLHLPGYIPLRLCSVAVLVLFFPAITFYFNTGTKVKSRILEYLHREYTPGIERYLLILLVMAVTLRFVSIMFSATPDVSHILLVLIMGAAGLQYFALNWYHDSRFPVWLQVLTGLSFLGFILPSVFGVSSSLTNPSLAHALTAFFIISAGCVLVYRLNEYGHKNLLIALLALISVIYMVWLLSSFQLLDPRAIQIVFNAPVLVLLVGGLLFTFKSSLAKAYMIMVIAHYLWEYPLQLGLW